jgi:hypothetical protein
MNEEHAFHKLVTNMYCSTDTEIVYRYEVKRIFDFTSILIKLINI